MKYLQCMVIFLVFTIGLPADDSFHPFFKNGEEKGFGLDVKISSVFNFENKTFGSGLELDVYFQKYFCCSVGAREWWRDDLTESYASTGICFTNLLQLQLGYSSISKTIYRLELAPSRGLRYFEGPGVRTHFFFSMFYEGAFESSKDKLIGLSSGYSF